MSEIKKSVFKSIGGAEKIIEFKLEEFSDFESSTFFHHNGPQKVNFLPTHRYHAVRVHLMTKDVERIAEVNTAQLGHLETPVDADKTYYERIVKAALHEFHLFKVGIKNHRQLVVTDNAECMSMIQLIPLEWTKERDVTSYDICVHQRSAHLNSIGKDCAFIWHIFGDAKNISYLIGDLHVVLEEGKEDE
jgi:hypothetical protein